MCAVFAAGSEELRWGSKQLEEDSLRIIRERAMWELSKLITPASGHLQGDSFIHLICTRSCPQALLLAAVKHCWKGYRGIRDGAREMCLC